MNKGNFVKGNIPWNKGKKMSKQYCEAMSKSHLGISATWNKGKVLSEETKLKISLAKKGQTSWMKGKHHTEESKRKLSLAHTGKVLSEEHKQKLSVVNSGKNNPFYGKKHTEEMKEKQRIRNTGKNSWSYGKKRSEETLVKIREARKRQKLPLKDTKPEKILQNILSLKGIKFKKHKQFKVDKTYHPVDIFIEPNICIEVDGVYWHSLPKQVKRDKKINKSLSKQGMNVLRFTDKQILRDVDSCMDQINVFMNKDI